MMARGECRIETLQVLTNGVFREWPEAADGWLTQPVCCRSVAMNPTYIFTTHILSYVDRMF